LEFSPGKEKKFWNSRQEKTKNFGVLTRKRQRILEFSPGKDKEFWSSHQEKTKNFGILTRKRQRILGFSPSGYDDIVASCYTNSQQQPVDQDVHKNWKTIRMTIFKHKMYNRPR
jgi:hypothetical protein